MSLHTLRLGSGWAGQQVGQSDASLFASSLLTSTVAPGQRQSVPSGPVLRRWQTELRPLLTPPLPPPAVDHVDREQGCPGGVLLCSLSC